MSLDDTMDESGMIGALKANGHALDSKAKKFWAVINREMTGWEDTAIKVDHPSAYERPLAPPPPPKAPSRLRRLRRRMMLLRRRMRASRRQAEALAQSYDARTTIVERSYDAPPQSVSELVDRLKGEGASEQLVLHTVSLLAEKSYDARTTIVRCEPYESKKAYDRKYQKDRRDALKAAKKEAEKIVRLNDAPNAEYISSSLPSLELDTNKESKISAIRAREAFEKLWRVYPKRQGGNPRKPAEDQFNIALKNGHDPERIIAGAEAYALSCRRSNTVGTAYVAHARTWLRQQRWNDDYSDHGGSNVRSGSGVPHANGGSPRKENGAERSLRLAREASARKSGVGLSGSGERVVDLDSTEWTASPLPGANGRRAGDL